MNKLEELWKDNPDATVDDLLRGNVSTDEVVQDWARNCAQNLNARNHK